MSGHGPQHYQPPSVASTGRVGVRASHSTGQLAIDWTPAARELAQAVRKRESNAARILSRLRCGPATTLELAAIGGVRFGARLLELRRAGHRITTEDHLEYAVYRLEG